MEAEFAALNDEEQAEFLAAAGLEEPGLNRLIHAGYDLLGLQTYFTVGPKEARAWTIHKGDTAPQAAGVIHTDFEKGFIRAETIAYADFVACNGEARRQGSRQDAARRQGIRRPRRRRDALPVQFVTPQKPTVMPGARGPTNREPVWGDCLKRKCTVARS